MKVFIFIRDFNIQTIAKNHFNDQYKNSTAIIVIELRWFKLLRGTSHGESGFRNSVLANFTNLYWSKTDSNQERFKTRVLKLTNKNLV